MRNKLFLLTAAVVIGMMASAQANTISGGLWHVPEAAAQNAVPGNVPAGAPDVSFKVVSPLHFSGDTVDVGTWLASGGAFNMTENTPGTMSTLMDNGNQGTMVRFVGFVSVVNGQSFTVTHDDGLTLVIGGLNLGFNPGPTAPVTSVATYTGPTGTFPFELDYGECCGGPAVLQLDLPFSDTPSGPEGGVSIIMLGLGLMGLAGFGRRIRGA